MATSKYSFVTKPANGQPITNPTIFDVWATARHGAPAPKLVAQITHQTVGWTVTSDAFQVDSQYVYTARDHALKAIKRAMARADRNADKPKNSAPPMPKPSSTYVF